jgi:hypothetical protein
VFFDLFVRQHLLGLLRIWDWMPNFTTTSAFPTDGPYFQ